VRAARIPQDVVLPMYHRDPGAPTDLARAAGPIRLEGDAEASDVEQVWLVWLESGHPYAKAGEHVWPVWPAGTTAIFAPELRILNANGDVILSEGEEFKAAGLLEENKPSTCVSPAPIKP
jgi:hypothetical protein